MKKSVGYVNEMTAVAGDAAAGVAASPRLQNAGRRWRRQLLVRLLVTDVVAIGVALACAVVVRFDGDLMMSVIGLHGVSYTSAALVLGVGWLVCLAVERAYSMRILGIGSTEYRNVARATVLLFGGAAIVALLTRGQLARGFLAVAFPLGLVLLVLGRLMNRWLLLHERRRGRFSEPVVVVGSSAEVDSVVEVISRLPAAGFQVVAVVTADDNASTFELPDGRVVPQLGKVKRAASVAIQHRAGALVVAGRTLVGQQTLRRYGWELEGSDCELILTNRITDVAGPRIHWRPLEGLPLIGVEIPKYAGGRFIAKRAFDLIAAGVIAVAVAPLMLLVAILVKLDDGGPVFYRQERVGANGRLFAMIKFRSMVVAADKLVAGMHADGVGNEILFKMRDDPRVTRVGKVLRRFSLDELPQLLNVLGGSMSLVGPRPPLASEVEKYEEHVRRRLFVKPGMTGPWQIGGRSNLSWEDGVRLDLYYVENWSMTGDLLIMLKTVRSVVIGDGAY